MSRAQTSLLVLSTIDFLFPLCPPPPPLTQERVPQTGGIHKMVIQTLLRPREWTAPVDRTFFLDVSAIQELCNLAEARFKAEPTVLRLNAPIKIFGDLHGQFGDLMRLFDEYGTFAGRGVL